MPSSDHFLNQTEWVLVSELWPLIGRRLAAIFYSPVAPIRAQEIRLVVEWQLRAML